jgi:hypothetical protein
MKHTHKFKRVDFFGTDTYQCGCGVYRPKESFTKKELAEMGGKMKCKICLKPTNSSIFLCKDCKNDRIITSKDIDRSKKAVKKRFKINPYRNYKIKVGE